MYEFVIEFVHTHVHTLGVPVSLHVYRYTYTAVHGMIWESVRKAHRHSLMVLTLMDGHRVNLSCETGEHMVNWRREFGNADTFRNLVLGNS